MENLESSLSKADKALPGVEIIIDGKKRVLKYTLYSLCKLDEKTGKNPLDGGMFSEMRPSDVAAVLWAGLLHEDKNLQMEELAEKIDMLELRDVASSMMKAFVQSSPSEDETKKNSTEDQTAQESQETKAE